MECLLQYLDDLDDLYGILGLVYERVRTLFLALASIMLVLLAAFAAISLAFLHAPLALATSTLLFVVLLYRVVTAAPPDIPHPA